MIGVPCTASRGRTRIRRPSIAMTVTRCRPTGFGRSADRVVNTRRSWFVVSSRGFTRRTLLSALVQPGQDEELIVGGDSVDGIREAVVEDEPRLGRALVALLGRRPPARKRGRAGAYDHELHPETLASPAFCEAVAARGRDRAGGKPPAVGRRASL